MNNYLDDFLCDITCEEFYFDDFWNFSEPEEEI